MRAMATRAALEAPPAAITATIRATIRATIWAPIRPTIWTTVATTVTVPSAMRTIGTPIGASTPSAESPTITAAVASAALRSLETGTRIGANAREILTRRVRITRSTGLSRKQNGVIFNDRFDGGTLGRNSGRHGFRCHVLDGFVVSQVGALGFGHLRAVFLLVSALARFGLSFRVAGFRRELCFARFVFRVFAVFTFFLFCFGFFFVVPVFLVLGCFMRFVERFRFILIKIRATDQRVGFRAGLRLFVLGFDQASGQRHSLFIAESSGATVDRPGWGLFRVMLRSGSQGFFRGFRGMRFRGRFSSGRIGFRFRIS
jgi:hypothetical protein